MTVYTYSTYQAPQPQETAQYTSPHINHDAGRTTSVVIRDGVAVTEDQGVQRVTSSELNPHHGDGSIFATARSMRGLHVREITDDTLVTVNGVQCPVKSLEGTGLIHKGPDGKWAEGPGEGQQETSEEAPEENTADQLSMPAEIAEGVDRALDGVADHHIDPLIAVGIGIAAGDLDRSTLERQMVSYAGVSPQDAAARVSMIKAAYQQQADAAITSRCGVGRDDLAAFYAYAKENHPGALRDAVNKQIRQADFSGYRALAYRFLADNPPTVAAVAAAGYETRQHGDKAEALVDGRWMTLQTAASLGYF